MTAAAYEGFVPAAQVKVGRVAAAACEGFEPAAQVKVGRLAAAACEGFEPAAQVKVGPGSAVAGAVVLDPTPGPKEEFANHVCRKSPCRTHINHERH